MSEASFWNVDWLTQNANRNYPLADEAAGLDETESWEIPESLIVDLVLPVHAEQYTDPSLFHILNITAFSQGVTISLGYNETLIATASVPSSGFTDNSTFSLVGTGDFSDTVGRIVIGSLSEIQQLPPGTYSFSVANGRLSPSAVRPALNGVSAIRLVSGSDVSAKIRGNVELVAGLNTRFRVSESSDYTSIAVDFIDGEGSIQDCDCDAMDSDAPAIRTINGLYPDENGNFTLNGSTCIALSSITNGLFLDDICSEPCCGCDELAVVTDALAQLDAQILALEGYASRLDGVVAQLLENVIASKTSDIPS